MIDGFAIISFSTYEDLEVSANKNYSAEEFVTIFHDLFHFRMLQGLPRKHHAYQILWYLWIPKKEAGLALGSGVKNRAAEVMAPSKVDVTILLSLLLATPMVLLPVKRSTMSA